MLEITASPEVTPGSSLKAKLALKLEESARIWHGGLEFHAGPRPCGTRSFVVDKRDVFCEGDFEKGTYIRERSFKLSPRLVPTFANRKSIYSVRAEITIKKGEHDASVVAKAPVFVKESVHGVKRSESNPVTLALRGIRVSLEKDRFFPGNELPIEFEASGEIQSMNFSLVKHAQFLCECHYRNVCSYIKPMAPEIVDVSSTNEQQGIAKLKIPEDAEVTHSYSWASTKIGYSVQSFGDIVHWYVLVNGRKKTDEEIQFRLDFEIVSESEPTELPLVVPSEEAIKPGFGALKLPIRILGVTKTDDGFVFRLENQSEDLEGVTTRIAAIKDELFEVSPSMFGVSKWQTKEVMEFFYPIPKRAKESREFQLVVESNNRDATRLRHIAED
ncbi:MAG: hypothetical protein ACFFB3_00700 [Candidatus Hodarchaeota archaeon]